MASTRVVVDSAGRILGIGGKIVGWVPPTGGVTPPASTPGVYAFSGDYGLSEKWDGSQWTEILPTSSESESVYYWNAVAIDANGDIYVGGTCESNVVIGGVTFSNIMKYSPASNTWSALTEGGTDGNVFVLAFDSQGKLYVGGYFTSVGNSVPASNIAVYDPTAQSNAWSALTEGGTDNDSYGVNALAFDSQGKLYVGGYFTSVGNNVPASNIAVYDPTAQSNAWSALTEGGIDGSGVYSLAFDSQGKLYVGGWYFTSVGNNVPASNIAVYDPTAQSNAWSALTEGGITGGGVDAMAFDSQGKLYVGGYFTSVGNNVPASNIAVYDPTAQSNAWSALKEGGITSDKAEITNLAFDSSGKLYVGGNDESPDGYIPYLAVYDPSKTSGNWSSVGNGPGEYIYGGLIVIG